MKILVTEDINGKNTSIVRLAVGIGKIEKIRWTNKLKKEQREAMR